MALQRTGEKWLLVRSDNVFPSLVAFLGGEGGFFQVTQFLRDQPLAGKGFSGSNGEPSGAHRLVSESLFYPTL